MRIIAGEFRSRRLRPPPDASTTRPMPDHVREAVFNLLRGHIEGQAVADVFSGTGSIGLEALSRGARVCLFVERDRTAGRLLRENVRALGVEDRAEIVQADALGGAALGACPDPCHLVFFDPPYAMFRDPAERARLLAGFGRFIERLDETGYAVLRTPWPVPGPAGDEEIEPLALPGALGPETHAYGSTAVHLYMNRSATRGGPRPDG
ncbi:MAG: 16S rRNA (guanine(966)-N(2))-methyltransferase RsmD [Planctomycetota bacterium]|nr:MAG: 16S rRNA (guanine(966)-N(2))-methyltransferase RsmD [Planctomycetota bacterium]